ncbi:hypothetical protein [Paraclostridium bifermentans]|uniref:hypothetical protein n=1 Tax=Paraclostridium bifermentans TaxID=1490 RepID=UPI001C81F828|nr:hypothetical protein [Paraclostridium bifermentans]GIM33481.1 hypothetical protein PAGU1678_27500 [Paraclostridium bifermentans subsp. muricolitidis]
MSLNNYELNLENEWLQRVLTEAKKQLDEKRSAKDRLSIEIQRELWIDPISSM